MGTCSSELNDYHRAKKIYPKQKRGIKRKNTFDEDKIQEMVLGCFDKFDKNHDGFLDFQEIADMLKYTYLLSSGTCLDPPEFFFKDAAESLLMKSGKSTEGRMNK